RAQARQLVSHGLIAVDGKKLSIPSARVRVGQEISFTDRGKKSNFYKIVKEDIAGRDVPGWLEVNRDQLTGRMLGEPGPGDWEPHFNPNAVIEYYSR
ncbi:MAG: 30S ribosomal protein S4, partial [Dehalococcoidia bacterium]|nr:30S ribosomal protein S4 [Dehalococcoidia bacterium]